MKLPIQAQPAMRNLNSIRKPCVLINGVAASDCSADCAWIIGPCIPSIVGGPGALTSCLLLGAGFDSHCRDCVGELVNTMMSHLRDANFPGNQNDPGGMGHQGHFNY